MTEPGESIPANKIAPRVVTIPLFRAVLIMVLFFAIAAVLAGIGSFIAIQKGNDNATKLEQRRLVRDKEQAVTNQRLQAQTDKLNAQEREIAALTREVQDSFARAKQVVCTAYVSSADSQLKVGKPPAAMTVQFLQEFGCALPPELKALLPT